MGLLPSAERRLRHAARLGRAQIADHRQDRVVGPVIGPVERHHFLAGEGGHGALQPLDRVPVRMGAEHERRERLLGHVLGVVLPRANAGQRLAGQPLLLRGRERGPEERVGHHVQRRGEILSARSG
jgi:hypothetical protein